MSTHPPAPDQSDADRDPSSDAAFLAWLRGLFGADGTLRVPGVVIVDEWGQDCIVLQREGYRAEVVVAIPVPPGQDRTEVSIFAENGQPNDPDVFPILGFQMTVGGGNAYSVDAELDQWGGWRLSQSAEDPAARVNLRPR